MANSQYEYVKSYEQPDRLLPSTFIVVRIDGRGFHKHSEQYGFTKPSDHRALELMNAAATSVMQDLPDIFLAYGVSDEYSFIFHKSCTLFERRQSKILTTVVSTFSSHYIHSWPVYFPTKPLASPLPSFDGRIVLYPSEQLVRDYVSWRQVDCHINHLYNTTFWALVQKGGLSAKQAEEELKGSVAAQKNEILFSRFQINYNDEPAMFRKGSVIYRNYPSGDVPLTLSFRETARDENTRSGKRKEKEQKKKVQTEIKLEHVDIIKDAFWNSKPWLLSE